MKSNPLHCCLFMAVLCSITIIIVNAADDQDLMDFDFADLKEVDWNYNDSDEVQSKKGGEKSTASKDEKDKKLQSNKVTFEDDFDENENQVHPFNWRERVLRTALSKALTNSQLRQRFIEVMPILRVLSSQQRLALSALISAQVNARKGQQLKLEQVRMMFGNDKKLLLPIVYDIANLVRNAARSYLHFDDDDVNDDNDVVDVDLMQTPADKRTIELTSAEDASDAADIGVAPISANVAEDDFSSMEDFFAKIPSDILDPQRINEELQAPVVAAKQTKVVPTTTTTTTKKLPATTIKTTIAPIARLRRRRRSAAVETTEFVHKLIRSMPLSVNEDDLLRGAAGRTMKLNTTAFVLPPENHNQNQNQNQNKPIKVPPPKTTSTTAATSAVTIVTPSTNSLTENHNTEEPSLPAYHEIEDLAFASLNGSEVNLSSSSNSNTDVEIETTEGEPLPSPEELISGPRYRVSSNNIRIVHPKVAMKRKRVHVRPRPKQPLPLPSKHSPIVVPPRKCERFTASMCIQTDDYPLDAIMGSIRRHKNAMTALLAEYHDNIGDIEFKDEFDDYPFHKKRREDAETGGSSGMCQSIVRYARPQKARSASGEWKYIVNTGQHTQTLRLEKCSNPQESCSYLAQSYRSHCSQVYNYHRLLSWDKMRGLHVDIFKVPTCCSCQIDGYRQEFPPLNTIKAKDFTPAISADLYSTISDDDLDYNDQDEDDDTLNYPNQYGHSSYHPQPHKREKAQPYADADELLLSSNKIRAKTHVPKPTVGSYLSPPDSDSDYNTRSKYAHKGSRTSATPVPSSKNLLQHLSRRRPYKSLQNEDRVDLEIAPSEQYTEKEVKYYGRPSAAQTPLVRSKQQRNRIYTVPIHTASSPSTGTNIGNDGKGPITGTSTKTGGIHIGSSSSSGSSSISSENSASAARPKYYTSSINSANSNGGHQNILAIAASHLPTAATTSAVAASSASTSSSSTTKSPYYTASAKSTSTSASSASAIPPSYHVNSIYSTKYGSDSSGSISPKRINYSYHPIIDFFEINKRATVAAFDGDDVDDDDLELAASSSSSSASSSSSQSASAVLPTLSTDLVYHQKIPKSTPLGVSLPPSTVYQSRERRIGFGAGANDNAWRPMVMES